MAYRRRLFDLVTKLHDATVLEALDKSNEFRKRYERAKYNNSLQYKLFMNRTSQTTSLGNPTQFSPPSNKDNKPRF